MDGQHSREAVLNEKFLADLGGRVRPICVFDSNGVIEVDLGASEYIDTKNIKVQPAPEIYGFRIAIPAKLHLNYPPWFRDWMSAFFPRKWNGARATIGTLFWLHNIRLQISSMNEGWIQTASTGLRSRFFIEICRFLEPWCQSGENGARRWARVNGR